MRTRINLIITILILIPVLVLGQSLNEKNAVPSDSPNLLSNRTLGVEFNPFYLLFASAFDQLVLSGGVNFVDFKKEGEINFPIFIQNISRNDENEGYHGTTFSVDAHYRSYFGDRLYGGGYYFSAGVRYSYTNLIQNEFYYNNFNSDTSNDVLKSQKLGVSIGMGYRYFPPKKWYWGYSLYLGRYLIGNKDSDEPLEKLYWGFEFFKLGYLFK